MSLAAILFVLGCFGAMVLLHVGCPEYPETTPNIPDGTRHRSPGRGGGWLASATHLVVAVSVADVHEILDALQAVGADPRLVGGWGIDALVGKQTREHRDLDLAIPAEALESAGAALQQRRFTATTDWLPVRVELTCGDRHVDLHPLHYRPDGSAWQSGLEQSTFEYPTKDWQVGHVGARPVNLSQPGAPAPVPLRLRPLR